MEPIILSARLNGPRVTYKVRVAVEPSAEELAANLGHDGSIREFSYHMLPEDAGRPDAVERLLTWSHRELSLLLESLNPPGDEGGEIEIASLTGKPVRLRKRKA